jgi:precorrin-6A/cobalt-precorrin-6A reductase
MIWVLSGTKDGIEIIRLLQGEGIEVLATAVTEYGATLSREAGAKEVLTGPLDREEMKALLRERGIQAVIDATHPFASEATSNILSTCRECGTHYLRFERDSPLLPESPLIHLAGDFREAAEIARRFEGTIFFAAGVRNLDRFLTSLGKERRVVARVLPTVESIRTCLEAGLGEGEIAALQGPFSRELNRALLEHYGASLLVTKESGRVGGLEEKLQAALDLGLPIVVVTRPSAGEGEKVSAYSSVLDWLREKGIVPGPR